jgi:hypothetical protein
MLHPDLVYEPIIAEKGGITDILPIQLKRLAGIEVVLLQVISFGIVAFLL